MSKQFINKGGKILECPLLDAAATPVARRVECSVWGCHNTGRDHVSFHPLPQDPDRCSQWLKLIHRQDLAEKLRSEHHAVVCSAHFLPEQMSNGVLAPNAVPSLLLPTTRRQFVLDGSSGLLSVPLKAETITEEEFSIEIKFEPDEPPSCSFESQPSPEHTASETSFQVFQHTVETNQILPEQVTAPILLSKLTAPLPKVLTPINRSQIPFKINKVISQNSVSVPRKTQMNIPLRWPERQLEVTPILTPELSETKYFDYQVNVATQTDSAEAFKRYGTFSAVEHLSIPPKGRLDILNRSVGCQTDPELVEVFVANIKRKLGKELDVAKKNLHAAENPHMEKSQFLKGCDKYLDEKIANFVKSHAYLSNKFVGKQYPADFKIFALKLYLWNPKSYKFVEQFFDLPSKDTIKKFRMPVKSGITQSLMDGLRVKVEQMPILSRQCVVCFDAAKLKKNLYYDVGLDYLCGLQEIDGVAGEKLAEYALLISVRGLYTRWKQPVSFALVAEKQRHPDIQKWLHKTMEALFEMSLNVKALVTNSDEEFLEIPKESYLEMKGGKIYNIVDFPDLLKTARNELMDYDFHIGSYDVKWEHVLSVFDSDKTQELKLLPNLTEQHVRPDESSKYDVKLATQLFSSDIAAAMHFRVITGLENEEVKATVQFMKKMKQLYEILYSRKLANAYRGTPAQNRFLKEFLEYLKAIQLKDKDGNVIESKFVPGLIFTIKSIKCLAANLKKSNVNYLLTKNLSKDFTQDYFKNKHELTPIEFTRAFRKLFLSNVLNNTKTTATGDDMMGTLVKISEYVKADMNKNEEIDENANLNIGVGDYKIKWPSNEYISGYLLWKCLEIHPCPNSVKNICHYYNIERNSDVLLKTFQFFNAENVKKCCNIQPPVQLLEFVNLMEQRFNEYVISAEKNVMNFGLNLYYIVGQDSFRMPCECFPNKFLRKLYIRLKIFSSVKEYNRINKNVT